MQTNKDEQPGQPDQPAKPTRRKLNVDRAFRVLVEQNREMARVISFNAAMMNALTNLLAEKKVIPPEVLRIYQSREIAAMDQKLARMSDQEAGNGVATSE